MARQLKKVHAGSPLVTNAACNRDAATRAFRAGMTMYQIAAEWPEVFTVHKENGRDVIGQKYDYELADGSGRKETNRRITEDSLQAAILKYSGVRV